MMQARDWSGERLDGWVATEKLDGHCALWDGQTLGTRAGVAYAAPASVTAALPSIPLDVEIYAGPGQREAMLAGIQHRSNWAGVRVVAFDAPTLPGGWLDRMAALAAMAPGVEIVPAFEVQSHKQLNSRSAALLKSGGEGYVVRQKSSQYFPGRTSKALKVKATI